MMEITLRTTPVNGVISFTVSAPTLIGCVAKAKEVGAAFHPDQLMNIITVDYWGFFPAGDITWEEVQRLATQDHFKRGAREVARLSAFERAEKYGTNEKDEEAADQEAADEGRA